MMGRTHALTGWCAGSAAAGLLGYHQLEQAVLLAATTAGFALLPDFDHPQATPSRLLGPVTKGLSWLLRKASETSYGWTKGPRDERCCGGHRHLTHMPPGGTGAPVRGRGATQGPDLRQGATPWPGGLRFLVTGR